MSKLLRAMNYISLDFALPFYHDQVQRECVEKLVQRHRTVNKRIETAYRNYLRGLSGWKNKKKSFLDAYIPLRSVDPLILAQNLLIDSEKNDVAIECSVFLRSIRLSIDINNKAREHVVIVNPSVKFISTWVQDESLSAIKTTFLFPGKTACDMLKLSKYIRNKPVEFVQYEIIERKGPWSKVLLQGATVIAFNSAQTIANEDSIAKVLSPFASTNRLAEGCRVLGFFARNKSGGRDPSSFVPPSGALSSLTLHSMAFLPRNFPKATMPRQKLVFQAIFSQKQLSSKAAVNTSRYSKKTFNNETYLKLEKGVSFSAQFGFDSVNQAFSTGLPPVFVPTSELVKTVSWHPQSFIGLATS